MKVDCSLCDSIVRITHKNKNGSIYFISGNEFNFTEKKVIGEKTIVFAICDKCKSEGFGIEDCVDDLD